MTNELNKSPIGACHHSECTIWNTDACDCGGIEPHAVDANGQCRHCGRDFKDSDPEEDLKNCVCPSDDCPSNKA